MTMSKAPTFLSDEFKRLYCDPAVFDSFSDLHPISFRRVLPFQFQIEGIDKTSLIAAEAAHLAEPNDATRLGVVEEYSRCDLLSAPAAFDLRGVVDFFDTDFFELMGLVYANAGRFRCALRWYRERIRDLETQKPDSCSDQESVYASVGYCLYAMGLFEETIAWTKACLGPRQMADLVSQAVIAYAVQPANGVITAVERVAARTRYIINAPVSTSPSQTVSQIKDVIRAFAPFQEVYIDWTIASPVVEAAEGYPFKAEFDASSLLRHRMNLIFATCGQADALIKKGYASEAKRLLFEVAILEPNADFVWERLRELDPRQ
jgi:hypothetical protein